MKNPDRLSFILRRGPAAAEIGEGSAAVLFWGRPKRTPLLLSRGPVPEEPLVPPKTISEYSHNDTYTRTNERRVVVIVKTQKAPASRTYPGKHEANLWYGILSFRDSVSL